MSLSVELRQAADLAIEANSQRRGRQIATMCERIAVEMRARFGWAGTYFNSEYFIPKEPHT